MSSRSKKKALARGIINQQQPQKPSPETFRTTRDDDYNFVIGIISYLPDDPEVKRVRVERLNALFQQCDKLLNLPIMIIAQNWQGVSVREGTIRQQITIHQYPKLGITGARKELRKKFLESNYDYLIMLDDDSQLVGNAEDANVYLNELKRHPSGYVEFKPMLLKLFAISKDMYNIIDLPDGGADDPNSSKRFFEDMMIIKTLQRWYPEKEFTIPHRTFMEVSDAAWDKYNSGWHQEVYKDPKVWDRHHTGDQTRALVKYSSKGTDGKIIWNKPEKIKWNCDWNNYLN